MCLHGQPPLSALSELSRYATRCEWIVDCESCVQVQNQHISEHFSSLLRNGQERRLQHFADGWRVRERGETDQRHLYALASDLILPRSGSGALRPPPPVAAPLRCALFPAATPRMMGLRRPIAGRPPKIL